MRRICPRFTESHFSRPGWFFSAGLVELYPRHARHTKNDSDDCEGKVALHGPLSSRLSWTRPGVFPVIYRGSVPCPHRGALPKELRAGGKNWTKRGKSA